MSKKRTLYICSECGIGMTEDFSCGDHIPDKNSNLPPLNRVIVQEIAVIDPETGVEEPVQEFSVEPLDSPDFYENDEDVPTMMSGQHDAFVTATQSELDDLRAKLTATEERAEQLELCCQGWEKDVVAERQRREEMAQTLARCQQLVHEWTARAETAEVEGDERRDDLIYAEANRRAAEARVKDLEDGLEGYKQDLDSTQDEMWRQGRRIRQLEDGLREILDKYGAKMRHDETIRFRSLLDPEQPNDDPVQGDETEYIEKGLKPSDMADPSKYPSRAEQPSEKVYYHHCHREFSHEKPPRGCQLYDTYVLASPPVEVQEVAQPVTEKPEPAGELFPFGSPVRAKDVQGWQSDREQDDPPFKPFRTEHDDSTEDE